MTTKELSTYSNEELLRLYKTGTQPEKDECEAVLLRRGNTITEKGEAQRIVKGSALHNEPTIAPDDDVTVTNGKITAVNGQAYP